MPFSPSSAKYSQSARVTRRGIIILRVGANVLLGKFIAPAPTRILLLIRCIFIRALYQQRGNISPSFSDESILRSLGQLQSNHMIGNVHTRKSAKGEGEIPPPTTKARQRQRDYVIVGGTGLRIDENCIHFGTLCGVFTFGQAPAANAIIYQEY